jgi:hypothetical protein
MTAGTADPSSPPLDAAGTSALRASIGVVSASVLCSDTSSSSGPATAAAAPHGASSATGLGAVASPTRDRSAAASCPRRPHAFVAPVVGADAGSGAPLPPAAEGPSSPAPLADACRTSLARVSCTTTEIAARRVSLTPTARGDGRAERLTGTATPLAVRGAGSGCRTAAGTGCGDASSIAKACCKQHEPCYFASG